jgi:cytochrome c oxidase assembly factor CtaG
MDVTALNRLIASAGCFSGAEAAGWSIDPAILAPFLLSGLLYAAGVVRLWRAAGFGRGATFRQAGCFAAGWLLLGAALVSPLHELSVELFSAHMVEHELVMAAAAPLLVLARPLGPMLWAFPARSRRAVARSAKLLAYLCGWDVLSRPLVATILHAVAIWAWHVPPAFEAALLHEPLHWLQHLSFLVTALFFWWAMFETRRPGAAVIDLFFTAMHTAFLGVLLTVAPRPMYPLQSALSVHFGLDPLADQQLAGLIMWVPAGTVYVGAGLALAWHWISRSSRQQAPLFSGEGHARRAG